MRLAFYTLFSTLTTAFLVLACGIYLSREHVKENLPIDKEPLFLFAEKFRLETERLDTLYLSHLESICHIISIEDNRKLHNLAKDLPSIQSIHLFDANNIGKNLWRSTNGKLPEVELIKGRKPLNPKKSIIVDTDTETTSSWVNNKNTPYATYVKTEEKKTVVILFHLNDVKSATHHHLQSWLQEQPENLTKGLTIQQGNIRPLLKNSIDSTLQTASLTIPIKSPQGDWQISSWSTVSISTTYNTTIISITIIIAGIIITVGFISFLEQKKSINLAANRVSFVNQASHELGSPLTNILLNLDLAIESLENNPENTSKRLHIVNEEAERLSRIIENILTFSGQDKKIQTLNPKLCIPEEIINSTINSFEASLNRKEITTHDKKHC